MRQAEDAQPPPSTAGPDRPVAGPDRPAAGPDRTAAGPDGPAGENVATPAPATPLGQRPLHAPFLQRLRTQGHDEAGFHAPRVQWWFTLGVAAVGILAVLPFATPAWSHVSERLATLGALVFLFAAVGLWLGLGGRAFLVATSLVSVLYLATAWTTLVVPLADFFVVAVVASFAIFALAGFNLVFVLEEVVYDVHVRLHVGHRAWEAVPTVLVIAIAAALPALEARGGPTFPALWATSLASAFILLGWWFVAVVNGLEGRAVLRELHLLVVGALLASLAADAVVLLERLPVLVPSLIAYLVLIGTWVYVTYTTLQRTHFLLRGENAAPWVAILLGASLAIVAHAQVLFRSQGTKAVTDLADTRLHYLSIGLWVGIAFYVLRSLARILGYLRDAHGLGDRGRNVAGRAARVAGSLEGSGERSIRGAADVVLRGIDHVLPGSPAPPRRQPGWELDDDGVRRL